MELKYGPYSPSRLDTAVCGYAFFKQYIDPERKKNDLKTENVPQARGSAVHEILEQITKKATANPGAPVPLSNEELLKWAVEAVNRHPAAYQEMDDILAMARLYAAKPPAVLTSDAGIELRLAVKLEKGKFVECSYDDPKAFARGRADIMMISDDTTTALVYDHKTQPNVEEADTFQMGFYAWVISKIYPFLDQIQTVMHFARYGIYSNPYTWTKEQLQQVEDGIMARVMTIEARQEWTPVANKNCQYCPLLAECPKWAGLVERGKDGRVRAKKTDFKTMGDTQKAVELAELVQVLGEVLDTAKDELKNHVKFAEYGIAIPGVVYEYRPKEDIHWDKVNKQLKEDVIGVFRKHNIDPAKFMGFSKTFTDGVWLFTENKALLDELAAMLPRKKTSEFKGYKA